MPRFNSFQTALFLALLLTLSACQATLSPTARPPDPPMPGARPTTVKILTDGEGITAVSIAQLHTSGLSADDLDPAALRLSSRGRPWPCWLDGQGEMQRLLFFAQASDSLYAKENVYLLETGAAEKSTSLTGLAEAAALESAKIPPLTAPPLLPETFFAVTRLEQNRVYNPQAEGGHWLWASLAAPRSEILEADILAVSQGPGKIRAELWSSTEASQSPAHHVIIIVNGQKAADATWDGKGPHTIEADLPDGALKEGKNQIEIQAPGDTGVAADISFLNWLEIGYPRRFSADQDRLDFTSPGGTHRLSGFSGPVLAFDVTDPAQAIKLPVQGEREVSLAGQPGHRYLAIGPKERYRQRV